MMRGNASGTFIYIAGLLILAATTFFFFSQWKAIWLLLYLVLGLACITEKRALFIFFLANVVVALAWALKRGILDDQTLSIFLIALFGALGFVATGANLGRSRSDRKLARTKKDVTKKISKAMSADKKSKKTSTSRQKKAKRKTPPRQKVAGKRKAGKRRTRR